MTKDHVQLVTYSQGVVADWEANNGIAGWMAPEVVVGGGLYYYKDYGFGNAFTRLDMRRVVGGPTKMLAVSTNDKQGVNTEFGLATFIDDQERENNPVNITTLEQRKIKDLVNTSMNNNLFMVLDTMRTLANAGTGSGGTNPPGMGVVTGTWSGTANDPVN